MILLIVALILLIVLLFLDARLGWPGPNDRSRYVSIAERSKTLRRP